MSGDEQRGVARLWKDCELFSPCMRRGGSSTDVGIAFWFVRACRFVLVSIIRRCSAEEEDSANKSRRVIVLIIIREVVYLMLMSTLTSRRTAAIGNAFRSSMRDK